MAAIAPGRSRGELSAALAEARLEVERAGAVVVVSGYGERPEVSTSILMRRVVGLRLG